MSLPRSKLVKNFPGCPVEATLSLLDGKWKGVILFHLMEGTLRFNEVAVLEEQLVQAIEQSLPLSPQFGGGLAEIERGDRGVFVAGVTAGKKSQ